MCVSKFLKFLSPAQPDEVGGPLEGYPVKAVRPPGGFRLAGHHTGHEAGFFQLQRRQFGGDGRDSLHGCAGNDMINGDGDAVIDEDPVPDTNDEDHLFGGVAAFALT